MTRNKSLKRKTNRAVRAPATKFARLQKKLRKGAGQSTSKSK